MRKILFVVALAVSAVGVESMRADAGCGGAMANPCGGGAVKPVKPPAGKVGLKLPFVAPKVGETVTVVEDESMTGTISIDGKASPMKQATSEAYTKTIAAASGDTVTKVTVKFTKAHAAGEAMGAKQDADLPVKGKSYAVESKDGKTTYKTDKGVDATAVEQQVLAKVADEVGVPDRMAKMLSEKTFNLGEKVTLTADEIKAMIPTTEGMTASDVSLTLTKNDGKVATFEMDGTFGGAQGPITMAIKFVANVRVDIKKSRPLEFDMNGDVSGKGEQGGKKFELAGKLTGKKTMSYK